MLFARLIIFSQFCVIRFSQNPRICERSQKRILNERNLVCGRVFFLLEVSTLLSLISTMETLHTREEFETGVSVNGDDCV